MTNEEEIIEGGIVLLKKLESEGLASPIKYIDGNTLWSVTGAVDYYVEINDGHEGDNIVITQFEDNYGDDRNSNIPNKPIFPYSPVDEEILLELNEACSNSDDEAVHRILFMENWPIETNPNTRIGDTKPFDIITNIVELETPRPCLKDNPSRLMMYPHPDFYNDYMDALTGSASDAALVYLSMKEKIKQFESHVEKLKKIINLEKKIDTNNKENLKNLCKSIVTKIENLNATNDSIDKFFKKVYKINYIFDDETKYIGAEFVIAISCESVNDTPIWIHVDTRYNRVMAIEANWIKSRNSKIYQQKIQNETAQYYEDIDINRNEGAHLDRYIYSKWYSKEIKTGNSNRCFWYSK